MNLLCPEIILECCENLVRNTSEGKLFVLMAAGEENHRIGTLVDKYLATDFFFLMVFSVEIAMLGLRSDNLVAIKSCMVAFIGVFPTQV